jgi:hypothetical protein
MPWNSRQSDARTARLRLERCAAPKVASGPFGRSIHLRILAVVSWPAEPSSKLTKPELGRAGLHTATAEGVCRPKAKSAGFGVGAFRVVVPTLVHFLGQLSNLAACDYDLRAGPGCACPGSASWDSRNTASSCCRVAIGEQGCRAA